MRLPSLAGSGITRTAMRRLGLATAVLVVGWLLLPRGDEREPPADPSVPAASEPSPVEPLPAREPAARVDSGLPHDCDALAARAREGGPDAVLLAWLCPDRPLDAVVARAVVLAVRSPDEAATLVPRLVEHPPLRGLLLLVAQGAAEPTATPTDPATAIVSPIDGAVLGQVQRAHALVTARGTPPAERTRARAVVAKVYLQATQQLGVAVDRPPEPFARLLAGRALHHGRQFCIAYLQVRVAGLAPLFHEVEAHLPVLVAALESSPHHGDGARATVELAETRRYLQRSGPRDRIARHLAAGSRAKGAVVEPRPLPDELARLLDHGLVDLALAQGIEAASSPEGSGLRAMEQHLRDALVQAERGEHLALLELRLARARARTPPPPEHGPAPPPTASDPPWPSAGSVATEAAEWIERAPSEAGLPRRYALGRALLLVRSRPDALVLLLDGGAAEDASPALRHAVAWLTRELEARDDGRLSWLQRWAAADAARPRGDPGADATKAAYDLHRAEASRRRRFAVRMREADRQPRGPGLGDAHG
jgi:hypothetical protein